MSTKGVQDMEMGARDLPCGIVGDQKILEGFVEARLVTRFRSKRL